MTRYVRIVFPLPLTQSFLYRVPSSAGERCRPGVRARAPLGRRKLVGFIVSVESGPAVAEFEVKEILEILDAGPLWTPAFLEFTRNLSSEFHSSWGEILQASLPPSLAPSFRIRVRLTAAGRDALEKANSSAVEASILRLLEGRKSLSPLFLQRKTGIRNLSPVLRRMEKKGYLLRLKTEVAPAREKGRKGLSGGFQFGLAFHGAPGQSSVLPLVQDGIRRGTFSSSYVIGADGARYDLYRDLIKRTLSRSSRVLFLVPEISMTTDFTARLKDLSGRPPVVLHGRLTDKQKEAAYRVARRDRGSLIVGTRSGLFIDSDPFGLIIVDGEHEESFHQLESPAYDARRGAFIRARVENGTVVYGSARPTVEAFHEAGRSGVLIDLGQIPRKCRATWIDHRDSRNLVSPLLRDRLGSAVGRGDPAILFLNRRGYSRSLSCAGCGHVPRCSRCDIPGVYHKKQDRLTCRYCDAAIPLESGCPRCGGSYTQGAGGGIQALEEEIRDLFPGIPLARFDADSARVESARTRVIKDFSAGVIPILLGTQSLAYRKDVARARFLGILSPEILLGFSDYRASQRTFQTVSQMMDLVEDEPRAEAVIQTPEPVHFSIRTAVAGEYREFFEQEIRFRRVMNYPPFSVLAEVVLSGRNLRGLASKAREFRSSLLVFEPEIEVLGPAFAAAVKMRDLFRIQVFLRAGRREVLDRVLRGTLPGVGVKKSVNFSYSPFDGP